MRKRLLALLTAVLLTPAGGFAQTQPTGDGRDEIIRAGLTIRDAVNRESIQLAALPPAVPRQRPRERRWPGRHPVLFGALVGLGTGLAVEAVVIPGKSGGEPHGAYLPMFSAVGAGIGSLVGLIVSVTRR